MKITPLSKNQSGLVSITVTLIFILLISLVTTSFAFLMRREQRQALDRQLSTQAFYAAESGINDAVDALKDNQTALDGRTDCAAPIPGFPTNSLDGAASVLQYTCLSVDQTPASISFDAISTKESTVLHLQPKPGAGPISSIKISWQATRYTDPIPASSEIFTNNTNHDLPTQDFTPSFRDHTGILRTTLIPVDSLNRNSIINSSQTLFLYPSSGGNGSEAYHGLLPSNSQEDEGVFVDGQCNKSSTPHFCNATITGINKAEVYLRLISMYTDSQVDITAYNSLDQPIELVDSQYIIDVTGRAQDVLRRVQVRLPLRTQYNFPEFALESAESICKRMLLLINNTVETTEPGIPACRLDNND